MKNANEKTRLIRSVTATDMPTTLAGDVPSTVKEVEAETEGEDCAGKFVEDRLSG